MKKPTFRLLFAFAFFLTGCYVTEPVATSPAAPDAYSTQPSPPPPPQGYQQFYNNLAPYGTWVSYPRYGYVWVPDATPAFRPYCTNGYWAYSDAGWTWVSDYPWGWATFHYGSWFEDPSYGWMWVPGNDWAPAWVTWGNYNGFYGWAPVTPEYAGRSGYAPPIDNWCFADARYMGSPDYNNQYYVPNNHRIVMNNNVYIENVTNITIINNTSNYNSRSYNAGPRREEVESRRGASIAPVRIQENATPSRSEVSNGSLTIYRPRISTDTRQPSKPQNPVPVQNLKPRRSSPQMPPEGNPQLQRSSPEINRAPAPSQAVPAQPEMQQPQNKFPRPTEPAQEKAPEVQPARPAEINRQINTPPPSAPARPEQQQQPENRYQRSAEPQTPAARPIQQQAAPARANQPAAPAVRNPGTPPTQQQGKNVNKRNNRAATKSLKQPASPKEEKKVIPDRVVTPEKRE